MADVSSLHSQSATFKAILSITFAENSKIFICISDVKTKKLNEFGDIFIKSLLFIT